MRVWCKLCPYLLTGPSAAVAASSTLSDQVKRENANKHLVRQGGVHSPQVLCKSIQGLAPFVV